MSTPIETNTEELQEILQTVYNLPNAGGSGGVSWDCVISVNGTNLTNSSVKFHVESGSLRSVHEKLSNFERPNVYLKYSLEYDGDFENHFCDCLSMKHFATDYSDTETVHMYFFFDGTFVHVYADSKADIDNGTLKHTVVS